VAPWLALRTHWAEAWAKQFVARLFFAQESLPFSSGSVACGWMFLLRFTAGGDYRFVYWGPAGSRTTLRSDVMNSFSWSYNVHGVKEWTFYVPQPAWVGGGGDDDDLATAGASPTTLVVRQEAGELVFVPATWKHRVVNLEETLSINHNWVTTANLDLVWDCLTTEIRAVGAELQAWNVPGGYGWEAHENMLRGCLGLDVSAFFLMCLVRGLDLLQKQYQRHDDSPVDDGWESYFDLVRLSDTLSRVLESCDIAVQQRLEASLADNSLGAEAVALAEAFTQVVHEMIG